MSRIRPPAKDDPLRAARRGDIVQVAGRTAGIYVGHDDAGHWIAYEQGHYGPMCRAFDERAARPPSSTGGGVRRRKPRT